MSQETEIFDSRNLVNLSPFSVIWSATQTIKKPTKAGGFYEKKVVVVENNKVSTPISVEMTRIEYERLRILNLGGINTFSATEGVENTKGYRPLILSGAAIFHEG